MENEVKYYELKEVSYKKFTGGLRTAAFRNCGLCGCAIDTSGGPGSGSICIPCGDALKTGGLRGCVNWDESNESKDEASR